MFFTRWKPFTKEAWNTLHQLDGDLNRFFDRFTPSGVSAYPTLNVWEDGEVLIVEAELPGLSLDDIEIFVTGQNQLTLKGERKAPEVTKSAVHRQERDFGNFVRALTLPFPVDDGKVEARLDNGVLTIRLPKHEAARPRKIEIKVS